MYYGKWTSYHSRQAYRYPDLIECLIDILSEGASDEEQRRLHTDKYLMYSIVGRIPDTITKTRSDRLDIIRSLAEKLHTVLDAYPVDSLVDCIDRAIFDACMGQIYNCDHDDGDLETAYGRMLVDSLVYMFGPDSLVWTTETVEMYGDDQPSIDVCVLADYDDALKIRDRAKELYDYFRTETGDNFVCWPFFEDLTDDTQVHFRFSCE